MTQAILQTWEKTFKYHIVTQVQTLSRYKNQISDVARTVAQRAYTSLSVNKEEEIRAWWRVQQEEKRIFWARRGYSDAQHGTNGYPHHGTCSCALCKAYWAGHFRFQHGEVQEASLYKVELSPLGFLSPPPRKEVITRAIKTHTHTKKSKVNRDVVIQSYPAMCYGSLNAFTVGAGTLSSKSSPSLSISTVGSKSPQPQGEWELSTQKKVKTVSPTETQQEGVLQTINSIRASRVPTKKKRMTPAAKRQSKMPLSA